MRLSDIEKLEQYKSIADLPEPTKLVKYIGAWKINGNFLKPKFFIIVCVFFAFIGFLQGILSLYFFEWFGVTRLKAVYLIATFVMAINLIVVSVVKAKINGMSIEVMRSIDKSQMVVLAGFILILFVSLMHVNDEFALVFTIEFMCLIHSFISIFMEYGFDKKKITSEHLQELMSVRKLNLKIMEFKKRNEKTLTKGDEERAKLSDSLFIYDKSLKLEKDLLGYLKK